MKEEYLNAKVFTIKKHVPVLDDYGEHLNINSFNFKRPSKFTKDQIRIMEMMHNSFARIIENKMSMTTRNVIDVNMMVIEEKTFGEYINSLSKSCYITILSSSIFEGDVILHFNNEILFVLLDRILGGEGNTSIDREFTDIELILVKKLVNEFIDSLKEAWVNIEEIDLRAKDVETNPQFARPVANNEMCLVLNFRMEVGEKKGNFTFCMPYLSIKPILNKLDTRSWFSDNKKLAENVKDGRITENLMHIKLEPKVILGEAEAPFKSIMNLEEGDVIKLNKRIDQNLDMVLENNKLFEVQVGKVSKKLSVQIVSNKDMEE